MKELSRHSQSEKQCTDFEQCVLCQERKDYKKTDLINLRKHYIEGCGQLCEACYKALQLDRVQKGN